MATLFNRWTDADVLDLLDAYPLALMVSDGPDGPATTPLPMLYDLDEYGRLARLVGHMALSNAQAGLLRENPRACFLFQGPNSYVSPRLVPGRNWAPTWNYALVRVHAAVQFRPELNDEALRRLVAKMESGRKDAWTVEELGDRYKKLSKRITAFTADVQRVEATFKLGQDEKPEVFEAIINGLEDQHLIRWMRRFARHRKSR